MITNRLPWCTRIYALYVFLNEFTGYRVSCHPCIHCYSLIKNEHDLLVISGMKIEPAILTSTRTWKLPKTFYSRSVIKETKEPLIKTVKLVQLTAGNCCRWLAVKEDRIFLKISEWSDKTEERNEMRERGEAGQCHVVKLFLDWPCKTGAIACAQHNSYWAYESCLVIHFNNENIFWTMVNSDNWVYFRNEHVSWMHNSYVLGFFYRR